MSISKAGGDEVLDYQTLTLEDVIVSSVSTGGSGGEDRLTENVTLNFGKFEFGYKPQKKDGTPDTELKSGWKIPQNEKV